MLDIIVVEHINGRLELEAHDHTHAKVNSCLGGWWNTGVGTDVELWAQFYQDIIAIHYVCPGED